MVDKFVAIMTKEFKMNMFDSLHYFLGLQVTQKSEGIFVSQTKYAEKLVEKFGLDKAKTRRPPMSTSLRLVTDEGGESVDQSLYRSMVGSLLYLTATRLDLSYSVEVCSRFQANPKESYLNAVKGILKYVKGTSKLGLWFANGSSNKLIGYSDADWAGDQHDRISTSGGCFYLGENLIS